MNPIADLRKDYTRQSLDESTISTDPLKQFEIWFSEALNSQVPEPNAMTLSTVSDDGQPSSRVVLL
ncbi:MAG: pyridoxamine 5'-phosphate oxidase family protein, partial [Cyclobacteriaceae bacterium]